VGRCLGGDLPAHAAVHADAGRQVRRGERRAHTMRGLFLSTVCHVLPAWDVERGVTMLLCTPGRGLTLRDYDSSAGAVVRMRLDAWRRAECCCKLALLSPALALEDAAPCPKPQQTSTSTCSTSFCLRVAFPAPSARAGAGPVSLSLPSPAPSARAGAGSCFLVARPVPALSARAGAGRAGARGDVRLRDRLRRGPARPGRPHHGHPQPAGLRVRAGPEERGRGARPQAWGLTRTCGIPLARSQPGACNARAACSFWSAWLGSGRTPGAPLWRQGKQNRSVFSRQSTSVLHTTRALFVGIRIVVLNSVMLFAGAQAAVRSVDERAAANLLW